MFPLLLLFMSSLQPDPACRQVPFQNVRFEDTFWKPRQEVNRKVSIAHSLKMLEAHGYLENFDRAAQGKRDSFRGLIFMDSDAYKAIEAASYSLSNHPDPTLENLLDGIIAKIAAAQMPDGYLNTWFQINEPEKRWSNLRDAHELYCAGHLFEAAVAHHIATGKRTLLNVATRFADLIATTFGPGKREGYCGHPEIELALVQLSEATGDQAYYDLARHFIANRGSHFFAREHNVPNSSYDGSYWQDDVPIADHTRIKGHAVRAAYLMAGALDVSKPGDEIWKMVERVWSNTTERNTYVTGGIGPSAHNEGFTEDYDLPNRTAYQETCASVAMMLWNHRLSLRTGDARYADVVERAMYNAFLAGVSLSGERFFYVNPLESLGDHHRSEWFACACCPPNVTRTLASLAKYFYATTTDSLVVDQYASSTGKAKIGASEVRWSMKSDMPWGGRTQIKVQSAGRFGLRLRIPTWSKAFTCSLPGERVKGYFVIPAREWRAGEVVNLDLAVAPRWIEPHPKVVANQGLIALAKGPLIYCFEQADNQDDLQEHAIASRQVEVKKEKGLGGIDVLEVTGRRGDVETVLRAIPYCLWDNRQPGYMRVWSPFAPSAR